MRLPHRGLPASLQRTAIHRN